MNSYRQAYRICCDYLRKVQSSSSKTGKSAWDDYCKDLKKLRLSSDEIRAIQLYSLDVQNPQRRDLVTQRILHSYEKDHLSAEAFGSLHEAEDLRLFSAEQIDTIIEQALQSGNGRVDRSEIDDLLILQWVRTIRRIRNLKEN